MSPKVVANVPSLVKYVALLAFNKIVITHPFLVSQQEDVILECIDSSDITIRIQALDLVQGMVTSDNLTSIVSRLMKQLKYSKSAKDQTRTAASSADPSDSDEEAHGASTKSGKGDSQSPPLPEDYRIDVIGRVLSMCSKDNYANVEDFDWYIDVLTQLVRIAPTPPAHDADATSTTASRPPGDISEKIGDELRNVAVKVRAMRSTVVRAAEVILAQLNSDTPMGHSITSGALRSVTWIIGEYAPQLSTPDHSLDGLLQLVPRTARPDVTTTTLHAVAKVFAVMAGNDLEAWTAERKSRTALLMARIIHVFDPLALHPNLEVQERAVEFIELLKLTVEAAAEQPASTDDLQQDPPLLLTQAIPSLFNGWELNSVATGAQLHVPIPDGLDLDEPIHANLSGLLSQANMVSLDSDDLDDFEVYYHQRPAPTSISSSTAPAISRIAEPSEEIVGSYQQPSEDSYLDADIVARRKAERMERNKDDPFYIPAQNIPQTSTPIHNILQHSNGPDLDIDSIPIMQLDLDKVGGPPTPIHRPPPKPRQKVAIAEDENLQGSNNGSLKNYDSENNSDSFTRTKAKKLKQSLLHIDSSHIGSFSLEGEPAADGYDYERQQREEAEMQQAMKEVERLRLEMQRANERIQVAQGVDAAGTVVKRKKAKKVPATMDNGAEIKPKKKKKKAKPAVLDEGGEGSAQGDEPAVVVVPKRKKKKVVATEEPGLEA